MQILILFAFIVNISALSVYEEWIKFTDTHSKSYAVEEKQYRFEIFQENLYKIKEHNSRYDNGEVSYFLKVTKFADLTDEEFDGRLNIQENEKPTTKALKSFPVNPDFIVPDSIDWRDEGVVTEVKDQGDCGSSFAFGVTGSIESQFMIVYNQKVLFSEQELIDCSWNSYGCMDSWMEYAYMYITNFGLSSEEQYPYLAGDTYLCNHTIKNKPLTGMANYYVIVDSSERGLANGVATVGPISVAVNAYDWRLYGGGIYDNPNCTNSVNHNALVVGYQSDHWIIKNSWGTSWGEDGYMRLVRGKEQCRIASDMPYPKLE